VSQNPLARQATVVSTVSKSGKQLETRILEHSIAKICSLLSVGFGEAGAEIIADNIKSGGDLNPMVPGRRVMAVFGFCDIRNFTDTTEVLQEGVMEFVNSIAHIVHQEVALHGGAANKNIGDAFLLVWKLPGSPGMKRARSSVTVRGSGNSRASLASTGSSAAGEEAMLIADAALASFVIIQAALRRSAKLHQYSQREDLNERMPGFSIKMGFGLHVGWAIEGAIGSHFKIDASYLSPHVNTAARLEAATKQFNVPLLLSEEFVTMLSAPVRRRVRQIDCVTVKGSRQPIGLYTYDVSTEGIAPPLVLEDSMAGEDPSGGTYSEQAYASEFDEHPDILAVTCVGDAFLQRFNEGFELYRAGDWPAARVVFEECRSLRRNRLGRPVPDGPSETLLAVMGEKGFEAPEDWRGYRELTEK
jgi:class 3 adenylate cyclase